MKNTVLRQNGEKHIPYGKIQSGLEAEVSHTLSPDENSVTFSKGYCLPLRVFKCEENHL
jgi:hypothetical protein